jgi:ferredoxin
MQYDAYGVFIERNNRKVIKVAEETLQYIRNVPGKYWVEQNICLSHQCCDYEAPSNFRVEKANAWIARVYKQPESPAEETQCQEAMNCCPMGAIHDDGEVNPEARKYADA